MPFRDDRDALLARADALARENERLREDGAAAAEQAERAQQELVEVRARLAKLEQREQKAQRDAAPRSPRDGQRLIAYAVVGGVLAVGALVVVIALAASPSKPSDQARTITAPEASGATAGTDDRAVAVTAQVERVRLCLDNADLYARAFLADPAARRHDLTGHVSMCVRSLAGGAPVVGDAAAAYRDALAVLEPHLRTLFAFHDTGQVDDAPAREAELTTERAAAEQAWRQASAALRAAARAPYQAERARAAERAAASGQPGIVAFVRFGDAASAFADLLGDDGLDPAAVATAVDALRQARLAAGEHARAEMKEVIDAAEELRGALEPVTAESTARDRRNARRGVPSAMLRFASAYNRAQYGRPYPF